MTSVGTATSEFFLASLFLAASAEFLYRQSCCEGRIVASEGFLALTFEE